MSFDATIDRTKNIHASDVAAILGLNPYRSPLQVWLDKTGRALPQPESEYAKLGRHLESAVADMYEERTGLELIDPARTIVHPTYPIAGTVDRLAYVANGPRQADRIVEIKTAWTSRTINAWGEEGTADIPEHYRCQGIVYLALMPHLSRLDFALFAAGTLKVYTMWRDVDIENAVIDRSIEWWHAHVTADVQPEASQPSDVDAIKRLWSDSSGEILKVGADFDAMAKQYLEARAEAEAAEERADVLKARLQAAIADADGIEGSNFRATWKFAKVSPRVDWESVALRCGATPDVVKEFTKDGTPSRRFLLKEI